MDISLEAGKLKKISALRGRKGKYKSWWILLDFHRKGWEFGEICSNSPRSIPLTQLIFDIICIPFVWSFVVCARLKMLQLCKKHWMLSPRAAWLNREKKKPSILTLLACHWGEQLRGANKYQCKKCQQKVDATKTCCPELERFLTFDVVSYVSLEGSRSSFSATSKVFNPLCTTAAELPAEALRLSTRSSWCLDCKNEPFKMWLGYDKFGWQAALPFALQFQESRHVDARLTLK